MRIPRLAGVNDQFFLGEELERAVTFHVNGVSKVVVNCWKHTDDCAALMFVGCVIDLLEDRFTCTACGKRGADVRPDFPPARMGSG
jgi:hypothetical protein